MTQDLLDYLADKSRLFISDLRAPFAHSLLLPVIDKIPQDIYSIDEWDSALSYLFSEPLHFGSVEEARSFFHKRISSELRI